MDTVVIVEAGPERLNDIQPLWEQLNRHHGEVSQHFGEYFASFTFDQRKGSLEVKGRKGQLRLFLAEAEGEIIGQCIVSLMPEGLGEIDSIIVADTHRKSGIGDTLMRAALGWLDDNGATSKMIDVIYGNESTFAFYAKYGFLPRSTRLGQP